MKVVTYFLLFLFSLSVGAVEKNTKKLTPEEIDQKLVPLLRKAVAEGADPSELMLKALDYKSEIGALELLRLGGDPTYKRYNDTAIMVDSALHKAAVLDMPKFLEEALKSKRYNPDVFTPEELMAGGHLTPLFMAATDGHVESAKVLLKYGADVNSLNEDHLSTPLYAAILQCKVEMVRLLLEHGANVFAKTDFHRTMVYMANLRFEMWQHTVNKWTAEGRDIKDINAAKQKLKLSQEIANMVNDAAAKQIAVRQAAQRAGQQHRSNEVTNQSAPALVTGYGAAKP